MPLSLQPLERSDLNQYFNIAYEALKAGHWSLVFPNGFHREDEEFMTKALLREWQSDPEHELLVKVIDTDLPPGREIVGISRWQIVTAASSIPKQESAAPAYSPNMDVTFRRPFIETLTRAKQDVMQHQAFLYLQILATRPDYQRRGVGSLQMQWGISKADEMQLPSYVESSLAALALYQRYGFEVPRRESMGEKWDADDRAAIVLLQRPVQSLKNRKL